MITKLIVAAMSAALVIGTASATLAAPKSTKQHAPREATVATAPQPGNPYSSSASHQTRTIQPVRQATIPEPTYFGLARGIDGE